MSITAQGQSEEIETVPSTFSFLFFSKHRLYTLDKNLPLHQGNHFRGKFWDEEVDVIFCLPLQRGVLVPLNAWNVWMESRNAWDLHPSRSGVQLYLVQVPFDHPVFYRDKENTYVERDLSDWTSMSARDAHFLGAYQSHQMMVAMSLREGPLTFQETFLGTDGYLSDEITGE